MAVTVSSRKTVSFKAPYTGETFQRQTEAIVGRDGYLSGGGASDDTVNITIDPFTFISRGIVGETLATSGSIPVPTRPEPWFLIASMADDDPDTGIQVEVVTDLFTASNSAVVAFKSNGAWQTPLSVNVSGAAQQSGAAEVGTETGFNLSETLTGGNFVDDVLVGAGSLVDPDGVRRAAVAGGGSSLAGTISPLRANAARDRNDFLVLRQVDQFAPSVEEITGGTFDVGSVDVAVSIPTASTRIAYFSKRGGSETEQWYAWYASGTDDLRFRIGTPGGGDFILVAGTGAIDSVWIAGQRDDERIVVVYTNGTLVRALSVNQTTGAVVDGPVNLETTSSNALRMRATLDSEDRIHVVYEVASAPNEVFYTRRVGVVTNFGDVQRGPVDLSTANNNTFPDIAVDRFGMAHVAFQYGGGADIRGTFAYRVLDDMGAVVTSEDYSAASSVGVDDETSGGGFVAEGYDYFHYPRIAITPQGEVFVSMLGTLTSTGNIDSVLLFSPTFQSRIGFPIVNVDAVDLGTTYLGQDIHPNETGDLRIVAVTSTTIRVIGVDTIYAPDGRVGNSRLLEEEVQSGITTGYLVGHTDDPLADMTPDGDLAYSFFHTTLKNWARCGMWDTDTEGSRTRATPHPRDVYLGGYHVPADATGNIDRDLGEFRLFNIRPKRLNYPFLVGDNGGRYQGHDALHEAVREAGLSAGTVVVRSGQYDFSQFSGSKWGTLSLGSGVSLVGEGGVVLRNLAIKVGDFGLTTVDNVSGNIVSTNTALAVDRIRRGDYINMADTGFHVVLDVLPADATYTHRFLVTDSVNGDAPVPPAGVTFRIFQTGNVVENLSLWHTTASHLVCEALYAAKVRNIRFQGENLNFLLYPSRCYHSVFDGLDCRGVDRTSSSNPYMQWENGDGNIIKNIFAPDDASITIDSTEENPYIENIFGDGSSPASAILDFAGSRSTRAQIINVQGRVGSQDETVTNVSSRLRVHPALLAANSVLEFEDENTRLSGVVTDESIKLTSTAHKEFEGTGTAREVITEAVNARVKKAGDTMTGNLDLDADLELGGDVVPDADNTRKAGDWAGDLRLSEAAAGQGNFGRVLADNTEAGVTDPSKAPLDLRAADAQATPLARLIGAQGMAPMTLNPSGMLLPTNGYYRDEFIRYDGDPSDLGTGPDGTDWMHTLTGTPSIIIDQPPLFPGRQHCLRAQGGAASYRVQVKRTIGLSANAHSHTSALPCLAAKILFTDVGLISWHCGFRNGLDTRWTLAFSYVSTSPTFRIAVSDTAPSSEFIDTGISPSINTWYYLFAALVSNTQVLYHVSTTPNWTTAPTLAAVPGSGFIELSTLVLYAHDFELLLGAVTDKRAYLDSIAFWELAE